MEKKKVLMLEDSKAVRMASRQLLECFGFEVLEAENGVEAIKVLEGLSLNDVSELKAVFSDVMMPEMDGITFLEKFRQMPGFEDIPVMMVSAADDTFFMDDSKRFGAVGYLVKPMTLEKLQKALKRLFPNEEFQPIKK
jgi:CheY-like chemotaxis protein